MSTLRFKLTDYHAINKADIIIDGITVLAGENGSGKSTLSRWLFYLINSMADFERSSFNNLINTFNDEVSRFARISADPKYRNTVYSLLLGLPFDNHEAFPNVVSDILAKLEHTVLGLLEGEPNQMIIGRLVQVFSINEYKDVETLKKAIMASFNVMTNYYIVLYLDFTSRIQTRNTNDLYEIISNDYYTSDDFPHNLSLVENGVDLIDGDHFIEPLSVKHSLYIDSSVPTSELTRTNDDIIGNITRRMILRPTKINLDVSEKNILLLLNRVIQGKISLVETTPALNELWYKRRDGLEIPLKSAASGIQSIAYLYRMLECGYLDQDTILLIDEPETHLHPQWVVEYANVLIRLYKDLNVKIVIASHSPDMVSAMETIVRKNELEDVTHFYQAKFDEESSKYDFEDLGMNIGGIFESFNVALLRMQDYGAIDL